MKKYQRGLGDLALIWLFGLACVAFFILLFGVACTLDYMACNAKWKRSGMNFDWGPIQGCMVQTKDGKWIPEERVREIDL